MPAPTTDDLDIQDAWDNAPLHAQWPRGLDNQHLLDRVEEAPVEATLRGASGKVLEVAAAEAVHSCRLAAQGLECHVLEPSETMLARAREHMAEFGVQLHLVRGIAEALPYPDHTFDRVLIDSAMDHLSAPDIGLREMVRVLKPDGRLIVSFVNYGSLAVRMSRAMYRIHRRLVPSRRGVRRFWDTPVPIEHTFECTYSNIGSLCGQYLEFDRVVGVSMLWAMPGWPQLLGLVRRPIASRMLAGVDRVARRLPGLADFVLMVWRPRAAGEMPGLALRGLPRLARLAGATVVPPPRRLETLRATPADPIYQQRARDDLAFEEDWGLAQIVARRAAAAKPWGCRALTGDPQRSALAEFAAHGPFAQAVLIGGEEEDEAEEWLRVNGSQRLDVVDANPSRLERLRQRLAPFGDRVRCEQQDLNFLALAPAHYDAVLLANGVNRVINLEFLFDEIAQALRPGGLLWLLSYTGERRHAYAPARLALVNEALQRVPLRFRFDDPALIEAADPTKLAPLRAVRSDEIVALAKARFDLLEERFAARLFPLLLHIDVPALERQSPALLEELFQHEQALATNPAATPCSSLLVLRKR